jgi:HptB-dependent secretion and biofilm anti anti-sigma factor
MSKIITMPKRFDYSAMNGFNTAISAALKSADVDGKDKRILLDCEHMDYIDSSGLGLLVMAFKRAQEDNCNLAIINIKPVARQILLLANLQKLMEIH